MRTRTFLGGLLVVVFGSIVLYLSAIANGPDRDLSFSRDIPSPVDSLILGKALGVVTNWPKWFYSMEDVKAIDATGRPMPLAEQTVTTGSLVRFFVNPKKSPWSKFEITAVVTNYQPGRLIRLRVVEDTKKKLTTLFDRLEWQIELIPQPTRSDQGAKTIIRGTAQAHTSHWRSRLFGVVAERILMNQVFYPDLLKLAQLSKPSDPNPLPPTQQ